MPKSSQLKFIATSACLIFLLLLVYTFAIKKPIPAFSATAGHVVISEVQISGDGGPDDEFVELYNPGAFDVVMTNWRLTRKNSSGTEANLVSSLNGTIPAHGFFLITDANGYNGEVVGDTNYSAPSNQMTNNYTVLLYSDAGQTIVDKVGFGTAVDFEGNVFSENPTSGGSLERKPGASDHSAGNGEDTDNNLSDFALRDTSDPQNKSSNIEVPVSVTTTTEVTATLSPTESVSETPTVEISPTESLTPTLEITSTPTIELTPTEIPTSTPTETPTPTFEPTSTPTEIPSPTNEPTATPVPTLTPTPSPVPPGILIARFNFPRAEATDCRLTFRKVNFLFSFIYLPSISCSKK